MWNVTIVMFSNDLFPRYKMILFFYDVFMSELKDLVSIALLMMLVNEPPFVLKTKGVFLWKNGV